jgi:hypothetical protein
MNNTVKIGIGMLLALGMAGSVRVLGAADDSSSATASSSSTAHTAAAVTAKAPAKPLAPARYLPSLPRRALMYYQGVWGVDSLTVKLAESGTLIRFSYRILDPEKAAPLNDKKLEPSLIDPQAGVRLVIPQVNNVGMLRQASTPEAGKSYWMAFSNSGRPVKRGDRVIVEIGNFHADGLTVE